MKAEIDSLLAQIGQMAGEVETGDLPAFLGRLEALRAVASARLTLAVANGRGATPEGPDRLLDVQEAARRLGVSTDYLYRHKGLPFRVQMGRRVRFSSNGIERYIRHRQGRA
jgi:excisionase family DNA binding protein